MVFVISILTFLAMLAVCSLLYSWLSADQRRVQSRMQQYLQVKAETAAALPLNELSGWRGAVRQLSRHLEAPQLSRKLEHKLLQAGWPLRGAEFLVICLASAAVVMVLFLLLSGGKLPSGLVGAALGYAVPVFLVYGTAAKRLKQFNLQLGDALILTANSLRTGYSFLQAIEMVSREMPEPIAGEFARLLREMNLGVVTEDALNNLAKRVNSDDLDLVITAVLIQRQVGGNLAEVLDNIAGTIRERVKIKGEIKTLTAQGRISGIIIGALPFCIGLAIFVVNPAYIGKLFSHPTGHVMLGAALVSQVLGALVIRKIVTIDV